MKSSLIVALVCCLSVPLSLAAQREWTDQATGRKITAEFVSVEGDQVTLSMQGKQFKIPVAKLSPEDQTYLKIVGGTPAPAPAPALAPEPSPAQPIQAITTGQVVGPIEVEGSHYFYYVPSSVKPGTKAPLIFYTGSGGGDEGLVKRMREGAEISGWVAACSVEIRNMMPDNESKPHLDHCLKHLFATQPVDTNQVYFSGSSGGSRRAFTNADRFNSAGVLGIIAGGEDKEMSRNRFYYMITGATDFNRYGVGCSFAKARKTSAVRFHPGGHEDGPMWLVTEGIVWLQAMHHEKVNASAAECARFEDAVMVWVKSLRATEAHRAAWWADFFKSRMKGPHKVEMETMAAELMAVPANRSYIKGIADLEEFAISALAPVGPYSQKGGHTTPEIQRKAEKILQEHSDSPWIKEVATELKNPIGQGTQKK